MKLQHGGHFERAESEFTKSLNDGDAGEVLVVGGDLLRCQCAHDRDGAVEVVGMSGAVAGQFTTGL